MILGFQVYLINQVEACEESCGTQCGIIIKQFDAMAKTQAFYMYLQFNCGRFFQRGVVRTALAFAAVCSTPNQHLAFVIYTTVLLVFSVQHKSSAIFLNQLKQVRNVKMFCFIL